MPDYSNSTRARSYSIFFNFLVSAPKTFWLLPSSPARDRVRVPGGPDPGDRTDKSSELQAHTAPLPGRKCPVKGYRIVTSGTFFWCRESQRGGCPPDLGCTKSCAGEARSTTAAPSPTQLGGFGQPVVLFQKVDDNLGFEHLHPQVGIDEKGNLHLSRPQHKVRTLSAPLRHIVKSVG